MPARVKALVGDDPRRPALLLTVRGSDPRLDLPTANLEPSSTVRLVGRRRKSAAVTPAMPLPTTTSLSFFMVRCAWDEGRCRAATRRRAWAGQLARNGRGFTT